MRLDDRHRSNLNNLDRKENMLINTGILFSVNSLFKNFPFEISPCFLPVLHSEQEEEGLPGETGERGQEQSSLLPWEPASCPARRVTVFALHEGGGQSV